MDDISRRGFLHKSTAAAAGCAIPLKAGNLTSLQADGRPRVRRYKTFGRTGWKVGDISAGTWQADPALVEYQIQRGINFCLHCNNFLFLCCLHGNIFYN